MGELCLVEEHGRSLSVSTGDTTLFRYVYGPADRQLESPRPYFHPLRTRAGHLISVFRPWDHVWHKGITWSLPNVGAQNFWGGPTYLRGREYVQLDNNGATVHESFDAITREPSRLQVAESLNWVASTGGTWFTERRGFAVHVDERSDRWTLDYSTEFTNISRFGPVLEANSAALPRVAWNAA